MQSKKIFLEVERKFSRFQHYPLKIDQGVPAFRKLTHLGKRRFRDVYFDHDGKMSKAGTWLRQRDGRWQSKVRLGGDYNQSQFREITDHVEIARHVYNLTKISQPEVNQFGMTPIADLTTERESWKADDRFKIVLDTTDFGHVVGEVELEETVTVRSDAEADRLTAAMDAELADFLHRYRWAFDQEQPIGKLTAYFALKK